MQEPDYKHLIDPQQYPKDRDREKEREREAKEATACK